jgi:hypothetical protein
VLRAATFRLDTFLTAALIVELKDAIGDRLASAQFVELRVKWGELLNLYYREGRVASGGSSAMSSKATPRGPLDSSGDEEQADELEDGGEVVFVTKARSSRRQLSPHAAKVAGKQKEEPPKRRQSKANLKTFDEDIHEVREPKVRCFVILVAIG